MIHVFLICVKLCKSGLYNVVTKKEVDYVHSLTRSLLTGLRSFTSHKTIHRIVLFGRVPSARKQKHVPSKAMIHVFLICAKFCKSGLYNVVTKKEVDYVHYIMPPIPAGIAGAAGFSSGISTTAASVVNSIEPTDAALTSAERVTFAGSTIPAVNMSTYLSSNAS